MPCRDWNGITAQDERHMRASQDLHRQIKELSDRNDETTRLFCSVMRKFTKADMDLFPRDVQEWWIKHQEADRREAKRKRDIEARKKREMEARVKKDALKVSAISKLTKEERNALGFA